MCVLSLFIRVPLPVSPLVWEDDLLPNCLMTGGGGGGKLFPSSFFLGATRQSIEKNGGGRCQQKFGFFFKKNVRFLVKDLILHVFSIWRLKATREF